MFFNNKALKNGGVVFSESSPYITINNSKRAAIWLMDDYGMGSQDTAWNRSLLEDIIDYRYRERKPTILTSNMTLEQLPERVVGRFSEPGVGVVVENKAGDFRRRVEG